MKTAFVCYVVSVAVVVTTQVLLERYRRPAPPVRPKELGGDILATSAAWPVIAAWFAFEAVAWGLGRLAGAKSTHGEVE